MRISSTFLRRFMVVLILPIFFADSVRAADCAIKNGMGDELTAYIKSVDTVLSKIGTEASKKQCDSGPNGENSASASIDKTSSAVVGTMNASIGFSNFYTSGRFYIGIALKTEIPAGITRDHERLGQQTERINAMLDLVHSHCAEDMVSTSNLSEDPVYTTVGKTFGTILKEVLENQINMMNFYRQTVLGDAVENEYDFILVGNSKEFMTKLQGHYGPKAFESCIQKSDYFSKIKDSFGRITNLGGGIEKGMDEWESAMALLNSNSSDKKHAETERRLLREEMSKQGMSTKGSQVVMNNLAKYSSKNQSEGLSGFATSIGDRVYSSIGQFEKVYEDLKEMLKKPQSTERYMDTVRTLATVKSDVNNEIIGDYEQAKSNIGPENQSADETVAKLIDTHILLQSTNKFVKPYIKVSEQTCDAQDTGKGNCHFR